MVNKTVIVIISLTLFLILFSTLSAFKLINRIFLFIFVIFFIATLFLLVLTKFLKKYSKVQENKVENNDKRIKIVFDKINEELRGIPGAEMLSWGSGSRVTFKRKIFLDTDNRPHDFVAFLSSTKDSYTDVIIYYDLTNDTFSSFVGEPSNRQISDIWCGFAPFPMQQSQFNNRFARPVLYSNRNRYSNRQRMFEDDIDERSFNTFSSDDANSFVKDSNIPDIARTKHKGA